VKLTKSKLQEIIKEEFDKVVNETFPNPEFREKAARKGRPTTPGRTFMRSAGDIPRWIEYEPAEWEAIKAQCPEEVDEKNYIYPTDVEGTDEYEKSRFSPCAKRAVQSARGK